MCDGADVDDDGNEGAASTTHTQKTDKKNLAFK